MLIRIHSIVPYTTNFVHIHFYVRSSGDDDGSPQRWHSIFTLISFIMAEIIMTTIIMIIVIKWSLKV